jgi:hypothetical protein
MPWVAAAAEGPDHFQSAEEPHERGPAVKAIRIHEPSGISGLVYEEAPDPTPMICEVLVKVAACGITHNELDGQGPARACAQGDA